MTEVILDYELDISTDEVALTEVILDYELDISTDEVAPRTVSEKSQSRAKIQAQIDAFLAAGGSIEVLPPCVSEIALKEGAKRSFTITYSDRPKRGTKRDRNRTAQMGMLGAICFGAVAERAY